MIDSTGIAPSAEPPSVADIVEVVWLPALLALVTAASTWLVWYYTHTVCTPEVAALTGCNAGPVAKYVNVDVFGRMLTYGGLVGGLGGFWRYDMIKKERAARIAAQNQLAELQRKWQEERQQEHEAFMATMEELRRNSAEERERAAQQAAEERERAAEERERVAQNAAEERERAAQQAAEERQAFLTVLMELSAEIAHLRQQRNGNTHNGD